MKTSVNARQKAAIETVEGPVLIIAGPGTGKTYTIVERVIYMVADLDVDPASIMVSTFTNKAARELLDRLSIKFRDKAISKDVNDMMLGNFHSICRMILDKYIDHTGLNKDYRLIDDFEKRYLIYKNIDKFRSIRGYNKLVVGDELNFITRVIQLIFEEGILDEKSKNPDYQTILDIGRQYKNILLDNNLMDFSSQLYFTYKLLSSKPCVRDELKRKISYIMIDEYQDTNTVQEKIIFSILNDRENICVVGDDDQGLYRFRGASVKNILSFGNNLKRTVKRIDLNINYRSKKSIIDFYTKFIGRLDSIDKIDLYRYKKDLLANGDDEGQAVFRLSSADEEDFRDKVVSLVKCLKRDGLVNNFNEIAILVSSVNDQRILKLSTGLKKEGIGVYTPKTNQLLARKETRLLLGALYAIFRPHMDKRKLRINYESYIYLNKLYDDFYKEEKKHDNLAVFIRKMQAYIRSSSVNLSLLDILYRLFSYQPFKGYLSNSLSDKERKNISKIMEILETFSFQEYIYRITNKNLDEFCIKFFSDFIRFLKDSKIYEFEEDTVIPSEDQLSILTIHSSKGLEYPVVIMASLWDYPYKRYKRPRNILDDFSEEYGKLEFEPFEEVERLDYYRKYFTGFSRAENLLILAGIDGAGGRSLGEEIRQLYHSLPLFENVDLNSFQKKEKIRSKEKNIYSYTQDIVQYNYCPRAYYFFRKLKYKKEKNLGMVYGSIVHEGIEYVNKYLMSGKSLTQLKLKEEIYENSRFKFRLGASMLTKELVEACYREVKEYLDFSSHFANIMGSELEISLALDDYILTGNVDLVYEDGGKVNIADFKTGKNPEETGDYELLNSYLGQISLYAYLYEITKGEKVENISLYFTSSSNRKKIICKKNNENKLTNIISYIKDTIRRLEEDDVFEKTPDLEKCDKCELRFFCDRIK